MSALEQDGRAVAAFVPEPAGAAAHTHSLLDMHRVAVRSHARSVDRNSCRPIARTRPGHSHNRSIAGHTGCRSRHAAVSAAEAPVRSIAAGAAGAAAGSGRTAAGMPWQAPLTAEASQLTRLP